MAKIQFTSKIEEDQDDYARQIAEEVGLSRASITGFALNLMKTYFTIEQLKSEVIVHGPKDHRRKE